MGKFFPPQPMDPRNQMLGLPMFRRQLDPFPLVTKAARRAANSPTWYVTPGWWGMASGGYVRCHLPDLWKQIWRTGNPVVQPLQAFQKKFTNPNDFVFYEEAAIWIYTRIPALARGTTFSFPTNPGQDIFEEYRQSITADIQAGSIPGAINDLLEALEIFKAVGDFLTPGAPGFGCGREIFDEFLHISKEFASLISALNGDVELFNLIETVSTVAEHDDRILSQLINSFPLQDRDFVIQIALAGGANVTANVLLCNDLVAMYNVGLIP